MYIVLELFSKPLPALSLVFTHLLEVGNRKTVQAPHRSCLDRFNRSFQTPFDLREQKVVGVKSGL